MKAFLSVLLGLMLASSMLVGIVSADSGAQNGPGVCAAYAFSNPSNGGYYYYAMRGPCSGTSPSPGSNYACTYYQSYYQIPSSSSCATPNQNRGPSK